MEILQKQWKELAGAYCENSGLVDQCWKEITGAYKHKSRHYHNLSHIHSLLNQADTFKEHIKDFDTICFAIWYHDIIYKVWRKDNEQKSADLARERLTDIGLGANRFDRCHALILATKNHQADDDSDTNWLLDFDLSVLGADQERYLEYTQQIRKEYRRYPDLIYKPGRKKVIQYFLNLNRIYKTSAYFEQYEAQARKNLADELKTL